MRACLSPPNVMHRTLIGDKVGDETTIINKWWRLVDRDRKERKDII